MGPLKGYRIIEVAGIGPGPFAAMMLADMGAEVIRIDRPGGSGTAMGDPKKDVLNRGRRSLALDLKSAAGRAALLRLAERADGLMEGFRPGVMERMGLGPEDCAARNEGLVYGRMTGWGQEGPLAGAAGHDINYIAMSGPLAAIGRRGDKPAVPLNLVGDFGGGAMFLAFGMVCGLLEAQRSGRGQVVDAAMVDGAALLMAMMHGFDAMGLWRPERGGNLLDSGAPFYDVYETRDGKHIALGALEPQFYREFVAKAGLADHPACARQMDLKAWPEMRAAIAETVKSKTRDAWQALLEGSDACFAPVLDYREARDHPHMTARNTFTDAFGVTQPGPAPRFSRTPGAIASEPAGPGEHSRAILAENGFSEAEIAALVDAPQG